MEKAREMDIDLGAEFVYMAATLIHIKSRCCCRAIRRCATKATVEEDPRQELVDRLLEHERFKNAAEMLQQKRMIEENVWSNPQIKAVRLRKTTIPGLAITLFDLVKAFGEVLERVKNRPVYEVADDGSYGGRHDPVPARSLLADCETDKPVFILRVFEQQRTPARHDRAVSGGAGDGADAGGRDAAEGSVRRNRAAAARRASTTCLPPSSRWPRSKKEYKLSEWQITESRRKRSNQRATAERRAAGEIAPRGSAGGCRRCPSDELLPDEPQTSRDARRRRGCAAKAVLEAIVYVAEEPLTLDQIAAALEQPRERVETTARTAGRRTSSSPSTA